MSQTSSATPPPDRAARASSDNSAKVAGATYTRAGQDYFEKRGLKRAAGGWGLWGSTTGEWPRPCRISRVQKAETG